MTVELKVGNKTYRVSPTKAISILNAIKHGKPVYYSKSKEEFLIIEEMATPHIKNSLNRLTIDYFQDLIKEKSTIVYLEKFFNFTELQEVIDLGTELQKRVKAELAERY